MIRRGSLLTLVSLLLLPTICRAQVTAVRAEKSVTDRFAFIGDAIEQQMNEGMLVGAVTWIWQSGEVIHHEPHGMRNRGTFSPMKTDTIFRIHSFTKAITTTAAMMLWEDGKFQLDDPVTKFLPALASQKIYDPDGNRELERAMTVRDLMRHTSGIIYGYGKGQDLDGMYERANLMEIDSSLEDFEWRLSRLPLAFSPGTQWRYGMSTDLLGRLVEVWSGQKYEQFLRARIFEPLSMSDTDFYVPSHKLDRLATLYQFGKNEPLMPQYGKLKNKRNYIPTESPVRCSPGGGLFSTADNYGNFLQMILAGGEVNGTRLLKQETVAMMTSDQLPKDVPGVVFGEEQRDGFKFGLGFNVVVAKSKWDPDAEVGEFGWGGAASCHYWVCPSKNLIVVTLESTMPYSRSLEQLLKGRIYATVE